MQKASTLQSLRKDIYKAAHAKLIRSRRQKTVADLETMKQAIFKRAKKCARRLEVLQRDPDWKQKFNHKAYRKARKDVITTMLSAMVAGINPKELEQE